MTHGWLRRLSWLTLCAMLASAVSAAERKPQTVTSAPAVATGQPAAEGTPPAPPDDRLVALGALTGAHLYTTYGYIGTVADAHRRRIYNSQRVREMMAEVIELARSNQRHLKKVRDGHLAESDQKVIDEFLVVCELLEESSDALIDHARSESQEDFQRYQDARTTAWRKLKTILGIKEPVAEAEAGSRAR